MRPLQSPALTVRRGSSKGINTLSTLPMSKSGPCNALNAVLLRLLDSMFFLKNDP